MPYALLGASLNLRNETAIVFSPRKSIKGPLRIEAIKSLMKIKPTVSNYHLNFQY